MMKLILLVLTLLSVTFDADSFRSTKDVVLDCAVRQSALRYGGDLLSNKYDVSHHIYEALEIEKFCPNVKKPPRTEHKCEMFDISKCQRVVYVATNGKEDGDGSFENPLSNLQFAIDSVVDAMRQRPPADSDATTVGGCVLLRSGTYFLQETIYIDNSKHSLHVGRYQCEQVTLSGGRLLADLQWTRVAGDLYKTSLKQYPNIRLESLFDADTNKRLIRARFPNADPERTGRHTNPSGWIEAAVSWTKRTDEGDAAEIVIDHPRREMENEVFAQFKIGVDGPASRFNPPRSYWAVKNPVGGAGATFTVPSGLEFKNDTFNGRIWKSPRTGIVHAFQQWHWGSWQFEIEEVENNHIKFGRGGFQEARGSAAGAEYFVENLEEELDSPNEFFFNAETWELSIYTNISMRPPEAVVAPQLQTLVRIFASAKVELFGLKFRHTASTFLEDYTIPSGGDVAIHPGACLSISESEGVSVRHCHLSRLDGNGVMVGAGVVGATLVDNHFSWIGDNAVLIAGHADLHQPTPKEFPTGTTVQRNLIREVGVYGKGSAGIMQALAYKSVISNNVMFNGPRAGINFNDGFGGGHLVEYNLGFNFVRESNDHGVFNSWDRQPFSHDGSMYPELSVLRRNFFMSNYGSTWPIDHDDGSSFYYEHHNVCVYGGFKNFIGHSKISENNLYVYPDWTEGKHTMTSPFCANSANSYSQHRNPYQAEADVYASNTCILRSPVAYRFADCSLTDSNALRMPKTFRNSFYTPDGDFSMLCDGKKLTLQELQDMGYDMESQVRNLPTVDEITRQMESLLYPITEMSVEISTE